MKKIKVKKFYNELNEMSDLSGDYVEVTMPIDLWCTIRTEILLRSYEIKRLKNLYKALEEATNNGKSEWYK